MLKQYTITCDAGCPAACESLCFARSEEQAKAAFMRQRPYCNNVQVAVCSLVAISSIGVDLRTVAPTRLATVDCSKHVMEYVTYLQQLDAVRKSVMHNAVDNGDRLYFAWLNVSSRLTTLVDNIESELIDAIEKDPVV